MGYILNETMFADWYVIINETTGKVMVKIRKSCNKKEDILKQYPELKVEEVAVQ